MVNLSRAKDGAAIIAERGPPERDRRMFRWRIGPLETDERACAGALNEPPGVLQPQAPTTHYHTARRRRQSESPNSRHGACLFAAGRPRDGIDRRDRPPDDRRQGVIVCFRKTA